MSSTTDNTQLTAANAKAEKLRLAEEKKTTAANAKAEKLLLAEEKKTTAANANVDCDVKYKIEIVADSDDDSVSDVPDTTALIEKPAKNTTTVKVVTPWTGLADMSLCQSLRLNYGLYTQCTNNPSGGDEGVYCRQCTKKTVYDVHGTVAMREAVGSSDYVAPNGKRVVTYGDYLLKANIDKDIAVDMLSNMGITLDKGELNLSAKKKRSTKSSKKELAKRGDDMISDLVSSAAAKLENYADGCGKKSAVGDEDDFIDVETWMYGDIEYLLDRTTNKVYDRNTSDEVGLRREDDTLVLV